MKKTKLETDYEALLQGIEKLSDLTVNSYEKTLEALKTLDSEVALQIIKQDQDIDDLQEDLTEESTIFIQSKIPEIAEKGDVVLLSPASASWDQYKECEVRGAEFKKYVNELEEI